MQVASTCQILTAFCCNLQSFLSFPLYTGLGFHYGTKRIALINKGNSIHVECDIFCPIFNPFLRIWSRKHSSFLKVFVCHDSLLTTVINFFDVSNESAITCSVSVYSTSLTMSITEKFGFVERNFFTARYNVRLSQSSKTAGRPTLLHTFLIGLGTFFSPFF